MQLVVRHGRLAGRKLILETLGSHGKTNLVILQGPRPSSVVEFLRHPWIKVLNIAGNRESRVPGIGCEPSGSLLEVFKQLRASEGQSHVSPTTRGSGEPWVITGYEGSPHEMDDKMR